MSEGADVGRVLAGLDAVGRHAKMLATHAGDVHLLAFERRSASDGLGVRTSRADYALDEHGLVAARRLWHDLEDQARRSAIELGRLESSLRDLLAGPAALPLKGTTIPRVEFAEALAAQERRRARSGDGSVLAEYEPARVAGQAQPAYPNVSAPAAPKSASSDKKRKGWRH